MTFSTDNIQQSESQFPADNHNHYGNQSKWFPKSIAVIIRLDRIIFRNYEVVKYVTWNVRLGWCLILAHFDVSRCAKIAAAKGYTVIGLQFYGECWSGPNAHETYGKYGKSEECVDGKFRSYSKDKTCLRYVGRNWANHVYRIAVPGNFHTSLSVTRWEKIFEGVLAGYQQGF